MNNDFIRKTEDLEILYKDADSKFRLASVILHAGTLQYEMELAEQSKDEIYDAVYFGFFARYYLVRKYARTVSEIESLVDDVFLIYRGISKENAELKTKYGYLLSIIYSELDENPKQAEKIRKEIYELVKKTDNPVFLLMEINAHGLQEKKLGNYEEAFEIFDQVGELLELENAETAGHIANILGNIGRTILDWIDSTQREQEEGDITISSATEYFIEAGRFYLLEKEVSKGHLGGLLNQWDRARKLMEKLSEPAVRDADGRIAGVNSEGLPRVPSLRA